jgi:hypothetical protein
MCYPNMPYKFLWNQFFFFVFIFRLNSYANLGFGYVKKLKVLSSFFFFFFPMKYTLGTNYEHPKHPKQHGFLKFRIQI